MSAAERKQRYLARQAEGVAVFGVELNASQLAKFLYDEGELARLAAQPTHAQLAKALQRWLRDFVDKHAERVPSKSSRSADGVTT